jgi:hypothetical protein
MMCVYWGRYWGMGEGDFQSLLSLDIDTEVERDIMKSVGRSLNFGTSFPVLMGFTLCAVSDH